MKLHKSLLALGLIGASLVFLAARVRAHGTVSPQQSVSGQRDGQHDFDFLVGTWKFHLKRLARRFAGSNEWVEFDGTTVCRKVLDGRAEVEEMNVESADKRVHIQGLALRLYSPASHQWSIYWANAADGVLEPAPMVGQFSNGRGEFYNQQVYEGRAIYARFIWSGVATSSPHFEQAFSADGGKTWETNWITDQPKRSRKRSTLRSRPPRAVTIHALTRTKPPNTACRQRLKTRIVRTILRPGKVSGFARPVQPPGTPLLRLINASKANNLLPPGRTKVPSNFAKPSS